MKDWKKIEVAIHNERYEVEQKRLSNLTQEERLRERILEARRRCDNEGFKQLRALLEAEK